MRRRRWTSRTPCYAGWTASSPDESCSLDRLLHHRLGRRLRAAVLARPVAAGRAGAWRAGLRAALPGARAAADHRGVGVLPAASRQPAARLAGLQPMAVVL